MPKKKTRKKTTRKKTARRKKTTRRGPRAPKKKRVAPKAKPMVVQTIGLSRDHFSLREAEAWIRKHRKKLVRRDETARWFWFQQRPKAQFYPGTFRTVARAPGVNIVTGKLKDGKTR